MQKIYWLEYVNYTQIGVITETFWFKSDMNSRRYELMPDNEIIDYGYDLVDLD